MIHIFDLLGTHCGMHYYDMAFYDVLVQRGHRCQIYSNYFKSGISTSFFPQFFNCRKLFGVKNFIFAYGRFLYFVLMHRKDKIVYLTYGELYELPFLLFLSITNNGWVDVHEIHALKYKDNSRIARLFEWCYRHFIHQVIYHSMRTYELLRRMRIKMIYVPHFNYVFQRTYDKSLLSEDIKCSLKTSSTKFLFFGNLSNVKGIDVVMNAFTNICNHYDFELIIAGKNIENIDFSHINSSKIKVYDRHINDDELVYLYSSTDYILLPYKKSSQSGIFAMAAYFHKPMILSDIPYFKSMIEKFPSFGEISSLEDYSSCIVKILESSPKQYYTDRDCERFEMKTEIDAFVNEFTR